MSNKNNGFFKFLVGLVFGLGAGFAAGILLAPKSGREFRRDIQQGSSEWIDGLRERINELRDAASDKLGDIRHFTDEKFKNTAINIQNRAADLGKKLEELTVKSKKEKLAETV